MTDTEKGLTLLKIVQKFIEDNSIGSPETIAQSDSVIVNAYDFIENLCDVAGYYQYQYEDEDEDEDD